MAASVARAAALSVTLRMNGVLSKAVAAASFSRPPSSIVGLTRRTFAGSSGSGSITYSGGQPSVGQGGFYGSGGARVIHHVDTEGGRGMMLALAADVEKIETTTMELDKLESLLRSEDQGKVTNKSLELKTSIKKLITAPDVKESLDRLELQGEPIWGLSSKEREMIIFLREKMQEV